ncbi:MAG TPA: Gfo/Idh/MocA family oxidoreductase [Chthonomonadales bacterium]|nr:Gfo/Idh/MocA family oxidoreductase [Chthonomonadales bacterium]
MVRVGLVGAGFMGRMHANVYAALPNAQVVAVADQRPEQLHALAAQASARPYSSMEEMLKAEQLDMADICLPTHLHAEMSTKAARARLHVLCEKPMAVSVAQADEMIAEARKHGVLLMVAHCIRFWPEYVKLREMVRSGALGALKSLNLTRVSPRPTWAANNWLMNEELSGSAALDLHIHDTDYALHLLGAPDSIAARGTRTGDGLSHIAALMTFGPVVVSLEGGWDFPSSFPFKMAFRAVFERGAMAMDGGPLTVYEDGKDPVVVEIEPMAAASAGGNISDLGGYYGEIRYFVECIEKGEEPVLVTPESSRQSLEVTLREIALARESAA